MESDIRKGESAFNMAVAHLDRTNRVFFLRDEAVIQDDLGMWFKCLQDIYLNVHFKLDKNDKENITELFNKLENRLNIPDNIDTSIIRQATPRLRKLLFELDLTLTRAMDKKNLILPRAYVSEGLKEIEKRLNI